MAGSFKPNDKWLSEVKNAISSGIATRIQMIKGTIARITQMEYNQRMSEMQSNYNIGLGWINALGGTADARNPSTREVWHVDYNYKYFYLNTPQLAAVGINSRSNFKRENIMKSDGRIKACEPLCLQNKIPHGAMCEV